MINLNGLRRRRKRREEKKEVTRTSMRCGIETQKYERVSTVLPQFSFKRTYFLLYKYGKCLSRPPPNALLPAMEVKQKKAFLHVNHASKPELISSLRPSGERRRRQFTITGSASGVRLIAGGTTTALSRKKRRLLIFRRGEERGLLQKRDFLLCDIRGGKKKFCWHGATAN